jgi:hypothetical protein
MFVMLAGGIKYLSYGGERGLDAQLVDSKEKAHGFSVNSVSETRKPYLFLMQEQFSYLQQVFPIKEIKLLVGSTTE